MIKWTYLLLFLISCSTASTHKVEDGGLAYCDFSNLKQGRFGDFATRGFPEYHYVPRTFMDGWDIVNNRGPEEWKVTESDGKNSLCYFGFNTSAWTYDFTYPILCYGDILWKDYTLEVKLTPLDRSDLNGILFRYRDGRHYYLFGLAKDEKVTLRYRDGEKGFRQDGWHELASGNFPTDPMRSYAFRVEASGPSIRCYIDEDLIFDVVDDRYSAGKIGLFATSPIAFHEVSVSTSPEKKKEYLTEKVAREEEVENLRNGNPKCKLWKKIDTKGFGAARAMRLGDLDNDGRIDFLIVQNMPFFGNNYNRITCMTALDHDGKVMWQYGNPDPEHAWLSYDVAAQIHDLDGDGRTEVIMAQDNWIRILEGHSGKEKARYPVPSSEILPEETSWLEYRHYYRRDLLPYLNVDCFSFADLRGTGGPRDVIIKDRHTRFWAYTDKFELLWTATANLSHYPFFHDSNMDGRDEVYIGYSKFDSEGNLVWSLDSLLGEHADGIYVGDLALKSEAEKVFIGGSDDGVLVLDDNGTILKHHRVGHAQTPSIGQFRPDIPGLEFCNINFWGEPGLITLYDASGDKIINFELFHAGSPILPVNWRGDGTEFIFLTPNAEEGGLVDGWGRRVVVFPDDGHPELAWMAHDITGDPRDELIVWDLESIWIYTQDRPFQGEKIYKPERQPLYNESNYATAFSRPGWE